MPAGCSWCLIYVGCNAVNEENLFEREKSVGFGIAIECKACSYHWTLGQCCQHWHARASRYKGAYCWHNNEVCLASQLYQVIGKLLDVGPAAREMPRHLFMPLLYHNEFCMVYHWLSSTIDKWHQKSRYHTETYRA